MLNQRTITFMSLAIGFSFLTTGNQFSIAQSVKNSSSSSSSSFRGVSFRNANKVEFKYKERIKNFKEQLSMGIKKGWLTKQEAIEFEEKIDVLTKLEKKVSAKGYPKKQLDHMEKMFTLYNQQFHKASTTPMSKKLKRKVEKATSKNKKTKKQAEKQSVK